MQAIIKVTSKNYMFMKHRFYKIQTLMVLTLMVLTDEIIYEETCLKGEISHGFLEKIDRFKI